MKKIHFRHINVYTGNLDDVEQEINDFIRPENEIVNITVTPELKYVDVVPVYWYHITIVYR